MDSPSPALTKRDALPHLLFWGTLAAVCIWVLLLPIFPTQDGPMHRYYVHVLDSLLKHQSTYNMYEIRHPLPPYLTHYGLLLILSHLFPYDLAEKVFACLVIVCLALGLKLSAQEAGPRGPWIAALCTPVLLGWPLMMGFFNFTLAIALVLFCLAFWQRIPRRGGRAFAAFFVTLAILTFTHPIPLLLLILICAADLAFSLGFRPPQQSVSAYFRLHRLEVVALACCCVAAGFPALAIDKTRTGSTLQHFGFHLPFLKTALLLTGISPYNSRAHSLWINAYRLALYLLYAGCMWTAGRSAWRALRERRPTLATTLFFAAAALTLAVSFLPDIVNGSGYVATRLVFVLWPAALIAAAAAPAPATERRALFAAASVYCCLATLAAAQVFIRPVSLEQRRAELQPLPHGVPGSLLLGNYEDNWARFNRQLAFDPFKWGGVLAFVHANDVVLDSPWIDQKITPIEAVPGGPELVSDIATTQTLKPGARDYPLVYGRSLPGRAEAAIVRDSSFVLFAATPTLLAQGLSTQLSPSEAAKYHCGPIKEWYMVCTSK